MTAAPATPGSPSTVAVVGLGDVGTAIAPLFAAAGHPVRLVSRRDAAELARSGLGDLVARPAVQVVPAAGAAAGVDVAVLCVPYRDAAGVLDQLGDLTGVIVVDATNYNRSRDGDAADPGPGGTTTVLAARIPAARWVKAFNMLWAGWLRSDARPDGGADRVVFVAADDDDAKQQVSALIRDAGFVPFDTGTLADAAVRQLEGTPAWNRRLTPAQAADLLPDTPGAAAVTAPPAS